MHQSTQEHRPRPAGARQAEGAGRCRVPESPSMAGESTLAQQSSLVERLALALGSGTSPVLRIETQISWVLVTGKYAYKIKKAVRLPFLDFSTVAARHFYCQEECRLNRRLAPDLYLDVVPVTDSPDRPLLGCAGLPVEYAVRMTAFEQQALWSRRLAEGMLGDAEVDATALLLGRFHQAAQPVRGGVPWGTPGYVAHTVGATLAELGRQVSGDAGRECLMALRKLEARSRHALFAAFRQRRSTGMVRECHGDLHCGNIISSGQQGVPFDGIEFNDGLRWIDVMDDLAFLYMDLGFRGRPDLAASLLNRYLETTGDYDGLAVLPYYRMHRALVRAKVLLERTVQDMVSAAESAAQRTAAECYLWFARSGAPVIGPAILITHGYSGSGKTVFARSLVQVTGAVQVRSDTERKRLHRCTDKLYSPAATRRTYERLAGLARTIVSAGWPVVVDAAFLGAWQRDLLRAVAAELSVPFFLFDVRAPPACLRERVAARKLGGMDASDAGIEVLEEQPQGEDPLTPDELAHALVVDTAAGLDLARVRAACAPVLARLGGGGDCNEN